MKKIISISLKSLIIFLILLGYSCRTLFDFKVIQSTDLHEIKKINIYAFPFKKRVWARLTPVTINKAFTLKSTYKVEDTVLVKELKKLILDTSSLGIGDTRMRMDVYFSDNKNLTIYVGRNLRVKIGNQILKSKENNIDFLLKYLPESYLPNY